MVRPKRQAPDQLPAYQAKGNGTSAVVGGLRPRSRHYTTSTTGDLAVRFYNACEFRRLNPDVWDEWEQAALYEAAHKRRFSMQYVVEHTRKFDRVNDIGDPVAVNNTYRPIWARMLASENPSLRPYIELRKSEYDIDFPDAKTIVDGD